MAYSISSVIKGASFYSAGKMLTNLAMFLLIPVFTYYLSPDEFGIIGYLQVLIQLLSVLFMLGFTAAQTRFYYDGKVNRIRIGSFLFSINTSMVLILICVGFIFYFTGEQIYSLFGSDDIAFHPYVTVSFYIVITEIFVQLLVSYYVASRDYKKTFFLQLYLFIFTVSFSLLLIIPFEKGALGRFEGILLGNIVFLLLFYVGYLKKFVPIFRFKHLKYALWFGLPIMLHMIGSVLLSFSDRVILERFVPLSELGIYTIGYQIGMIMSVLVVSINKSWQPNYFKLMQSDLSLESKRHEYRTFFAYWLIFISIICAAGLLFSKEFIFLFVPSEYIDASKIIPLILLGYVFQGAYHILNSTIYYYKKQFLMPFLTVFLVAMNIGLNLLLIPRIGMEGAAVATLLSFMIQSLLIGIIAGRYFTAHLEKRYLIVFLSLYLLYESGQWLELSLLNSFLKVLIFSLFLWIVLRLYKKYIDFDLVKCKITRYFRK